jgi:hypothetical protein
MTVTEKREIIERAFPEREPVMPTLEISKNGTEVGNLRRFRRFTRMVSSLPELAARAQSALKELGDVPEAADVIGLGTSAAVRFVLVGSALVTAGETLRQVLALPETKDDHVRIKLPVPSNFGVLVRSLSLVEKALSQNITAPGINGRVDVVRWETGSFWITLAVGSIIAVGFVGSLAWAAAVVAKKMQEARLVAEHVRSLEIKNESLQEIESAQGALLKIMVESEAKHLQQEYFKNEPDPERTERLKFAVASLGELIADGAEVHPALNAPEAVTNLFPNFHNLIGIVSKVKQIPENTPPDDAK